MNKRIAVVSLNKESRLTNAVGNAETLGFQQERTNLNVK